MADAGEMEECRPPNGTPVGGAKAEASALNHREFSQLLVAVPSVMVREVCGCSCVIHATAREGGR